MAVSPYSDLAPAARLALPGPAGFVGAGKVGTALALLLHARGVGVIAVSGRTPQSSRRMAASAHLPPGTATPIAQTVARSSLVFLTVPDDAIAPLCRQIAEEGGWREGQGVVHCSGALPSSILQPARDAGALVASFHPLQAFASLDAALANLPGSTFAIEGDPELVAQLDVLADLLGGTAIHLQAGQKTLYHAAAVLASNYTVALAALASDLLVREGIAGDINIALRYLLPLIRGTVDNLEASGLPQALTGPLVRGDAGTVSRHIEALEETSPDLAALYKLLGRLALPFAQEKGKLDDSTLNALRQMLSDSRPGD